MRKKIIILTTLIAGCADVHSNVGGVSEQNYEETSYQTKNIEHKTSYTVKGKKYKVFANNKDFQEIGVASWYGPGFNGRKTANGERFNMYAMTAAHKTLPLGSYVEVKRLDNDESITVRINDRGPFHKGRVIDLSKAAAKKLGIIQDGKALVFIKSVPAPKNK